MQIKSAIKKLFLYKFSRQQVSYLLSAVVGLSVLSIVFGYLEACGGGHVYLTFIPIEIKIAIAQIVEVGALLAVIYFIIRFILGFFIDKEDKKSPELKAIERLHSIFSKDGMGSQNSGTREVNQEIRGKLNKISKKK